MGSERDRPARLPWSRVMAFSLIPVVVLWIGAETSLWLLGYSKTGRLPASPPEITTVRREGRDFLMYRLRETQSRPFLFPKTKGSKTVRIFCTGGSSVDGHFFRDVSWPRQLEAMLFSMYPERDFEVINGGLIGADSRFELAAVESVLKHDIDILVIQSGNNEFLERPSLPDFWGRPVVEAVADIGRVIPFFIQLRVNARIERAKGADEKGRNFRRGVAGLRPIFPRESIYADFEANLRRMARVARDAGTAVVLVTPPSNVHDFGPMGLEPWLDPRISEETERVALLEEATRLPPTEARDRLRPILEDVVFRDWALWVLGRRYAAAGDWEQAWSYFEGLEFVVRPSPEITAAIKSVATSEGGILVDARAAYRDAVEGGTPPSALIPDHVHGSGRGNHLFAREIALALDGASWGPGGTPPSLELVRARLGVSIHELADGYLRYMQDALRHERLTVVERIFNALPEGAATAEAQHLVDLVTGLLEGTLEPPLPPDLHGAYEALDPLAQGWLREFFPDVLADVARSGTDG